MGGKNRCIKGGDAAMWRLRSCPKCRGDVFVDYDMNGWYEQCLQCGYLHDLNTVLEVKGQPIKEQPHARKRELALAGNHKKL